MKTFTYKQALEVINKYFKGAIILQVWDEISSLDIHFQDACGKQWELISTGDAYFQKNHDFEIIEV